MRRSVVESVTVVGAVLNPGVQSHPVRRGRRASECPVDDGQLASGIDLSSLTHPAPRTAANCAQPTNEVGTVRLKN